MHANDRSCMTEFVEIARPKVNLTLRILGRRSDGYHALASVVAFADGPADRITLDLARPRGVSASGPFAAGIAGVNLLQTVLDLIAAAPEAEGVRLGHVQLEKNLPVAAGIGGGSADAGALLRAIRTANPQLARAIDWQGVALRLGADVPVCLFDRPAFMTGIGERLAPVEQLPRLDVVLVNPMVAVPSDKTAQVFRALAAPLLSPTCDDPGLPAIGSREALVAMIDGGNDLERAACGVVPALDGVLRRLRAVTGCRAAAMSGAGPTCFGVFDDVGAARAAAAHLASEHPNWWSVPAVLN